jgi:hypothetical protein
MNKTHISMTETYLSAFAVTILIVFPLQYKSLTLNFSWINQPLQMGPLKQYTTHEINEYYINKPFVTMTQTYLSVSAATILIVFPLQYKSLTFKLLMD